MNRLINVIGIDVLHALVWSLVHSIWQAGLVAGFVALIANAASVQDANWRGRWYGFGMVACLVLSVLTFFHYFRHGPLRLSLGSGDSVKLSMYIPISNEANWLAQLSSYINHHLLQIIVIWSFGLFIALLFHMWGWRCNHVLKKVHTEALPEPWRTTFSALAVKLGIHHSIQFCLTHKVAVPCVIGYFKPMLLLPASLLLGMSPQQIEIIVLHELAHIRRHDVLIANVQNLIKVFYFFNPFVFWISARLDQERENACDDIAVSACSNRILYAKTLQHFAEMHAHFSTKIAITGGKNMLKHRIQRLFITKKNSADSVKKSISAMLLMSLMMTTAAYAWINTTSNNQISLQAKNLPLKQVLQQAEIACPGSTSKIKLRQADVMVNVNFSNINCADVPGLFIDMQERFGMRFTDVKFHAALDIIKQQCPTIFRDIRLKNPNALYSVNMQDVSCVEILNAVAEFDAQAK
jgi:beta-lactamase regulating signal transducer with metallopeptidase domain